MIQRSLSCLCVAVLCLATALAQQATPPLPPPPGGSAAAPVLNSDGEPALPGALPKSTPAALRETWQRLLSTSLSGAAQREPVRAFDLHVDLRYKAAENRSNDFPDARYVYLAPGFLRASIHSKREILRGPKGDFLIEKDAEPARVIDLSIERTYAEDRRQLDESVGIARNFAALTDPSALRVVSLKALAKAPEPLPEPLRKAAEALSWIELISPDMYQRQSAKSGANARIALGIGSAGLVELAIVDSERGAGAPPLCLRLDKYQQLDGFQVPFWIRVYLAESAEGRIGYMPEPSMELYLKSRSSLRATLTPEQFTAQ